MRAEALKWPGLAVATSRTGRGLIATRHFRRGSVITPITGRRVSAELVWDTGGRFADNCFRYGPESYLDPQDGPGRWLNHSCRPNAAIHKDRHRLLLVATDPVRSGDEVVMDYSTIIGRDDIWTMRCRCGAKGCRRRVRSIASLPDSLLRQYVERNMVPRFILRTTEPSGD